MTTPINTNTLNLNKKKSLDLSRPPPLDLPTPHLAFPNPIFPETQLPTNDNKDITGTQLN